jgi:hypothetical protein
MIAKREFPCDIPWVYVLYSKLVCPLYFSPFSFSPLLMVISTGLKILYLLLQRKSISHVHLLNFLLLPPSLICDLPLVRPVFHSIAVFVLGLYSTYERKRGLLAFWTWLTSLKMMFSSSIHLPADKKNFILLYGWIKFHCIQISNFFFVAALGLNLGPHTR